MTAAPSDLLRGRDVFRVVHVSALALCAIMLPWSKALLSLAQLLLVVNWLAEGVVRKDLKERFRRVFTQGPSLVFISFFLLHVLGLAWTSDLKWGVDLVRILLPVLAFGAVLSAAPRLDRSEFGAVLLLGAWSVVVSTVACLIARQGQVEDYRSLSVFISHIRLSLLLCLAIVVFLMDRGGPRWFRLLGYGAALWSVLFIDRLGSIQGYIILACIAAVFAWRWSGGRGPFTRWAVRGVLVLLPTLALLLAWSEVRDRYRLPDPTIIPKFERTAGGEYYQHDISNPQMENGHHVWMYVAMHELKRTWERRSPRSLDGTDDKGHPIWSTLVRYMASKGLRKDSVSLMTLSDADIRAVEAGVANANPGRLSGLSARLDEVIFELQQYHAMGAVDGHSVAMRIEYLRTGWRIARANWLLGVGTGDTERMFQDEYERSGTELSPPWRRRAHDQYLTLWISFGVPGLIWSLFSWWWPARARGAWREPLFIAFALIFGVSCLTDDTVETQVGATFFALYYTLFVFAAPRTTGQEARSTALPPAAG
ncbi:MAG: O-antigen ligase family protein [Flavobacteriales bacterium]